MQKYSYQALTPDGKTIRGTMIANNDEELKQLVAKAGNTVVKFTKLATDSDGTKPLPLKLVSNFCSQLGAILKAGLPLASALDMLYGKTEPGPLKKSIGKIYEMVQKGNSLSDSINSESKWVTSKYTPPLSVPLFSRISLYIDLATTSLVASSIRSS